jgi:hypothetical protein
MRREGQRKGEERREGKGREGKGRGEEGRGWETKTQADLRRCATLRSPRSALCA